MRANSSEPDAGTIASEHEYRLWIARFDALWAMPSAPERHRHEMQQLLERMEAYEALHAEPSTHPATHSATHLAANPAIAPPSLPPLSLQTGDTQ
ncbi:MAG TPA: hypothetical protein VN019_06400 [Oxalicibacterium sp.]|nr:hypothetical protein [Oxalicibacterium sp.]